MDVHPRSRGGDSGTKPLGITESDRAVAGINAVRRGRRRAYAAMVAWANSLHGPRSPVGETQRSQ